MKTVEKTPAKKSFLQTIILLLIDIVVAVFFAAFIVQFFPPIYFKSIQIDLILFFISFFILLHFLFIRIIKGFILKIITYLGFIISIILYSYATNSWSLKTIYTNAQINTIQLFVNISSQVDIKPAVDIVVPHISMQQRMQQKVDYKDSIVRVFAVEKSLLYFEDYYFKFRQICRQMSLFKYIRDNFRYVNDPKDFDYFAPPQETIKLMAGDCDDYSIMMASVFKAIGADIRIIWAPRHVYPELYCGNKKNFDNYASAIYSIFGEELDNKKIYYRIDKNNDYWINLDYTDNYPGARYYSEEVLYIIYIK